jgi:hypothetical protein
MHRVPEAFCGVCRSPYVDKSLSRTGHGYCTNDGCHRGLANKASRHAQGGAAGSAMPRHPPPPPPPGAAGSSSRPPAPPPPPPPVQMPLREEETWQDDRWNEWSNRSYSSAGEWPFPPLSPLPPLAAPPGCSWPPSTSQQQTTHNVLCTRSALALVAHKSTQTEMRLADKSIQVAIDLTTIVPRSPPLGVQPLGDPSTRVPSTPPRKRPKHEDEQQKRSRHAGSSTSSRKQAILNHCESHQHSLVQLLRCLA